MSEIYAEAPETTSNPNGNKTPSQQGVYAKIASKADNIIEKLFTLMESRNEAIALGAAKILANKILPDKKAVEVTGENGEPIKLFINAGNGFVPASLTAPSTSEGSDSGRSSQVQSASVASESTKDDNSDNRDSEASPS